MSGWNVLRVTLAAICTAVAIGLFLSGHWVLGLIAVVVGLFVDLRELRVPAGQEHMLRNPGKAEKGSKDR